MRDRVEYSRSSRLVSLPVLITCLVLAALSAFAGQTALAGVLLFLFVLGGVARLWAAASVQRVQLTLSTRSRGLFPGESIELTCEVHNNKLLPVVWPELFFPLDKRLCLVPRSSRAPDDWEVTRLREENASTELVGEERLPLLLWYERARFTTTWTARRRGVYSTGCWRLRTGDGLGLALVERPIPKEDARQLVVYPRLVPVSPELFLRNLWNADTGARGMMQDPTIIRSTRDYMTTDPVRQINWRLAARGQPLTINVYEDILPRSVHFILDGDSFFGQEEALEETLSILASEIVRLHGHQVRCGLSLSAGESGPAANWFAAETPYVLLQALAAWQPAPPVWDEEAGRMTASVSVFAEGPIYDAAKRTGRFYYLCHSTDGLAARTLPLRLGTACLTLLTWQECRPYGGFETVCLDTLRQGGTHG